MSLSILIGLRSKMPAQPTPVCTLIDRFHFPILPSHFFIKNWSVDGNSHVVITFHFFKHLKSQLSVLCALSWIVKALASPLLGRCPGFGVYIPPPTPLSLARTPAAAIPKTDPPASPSPSRSYQGSNEAACTDSCLFNDGRFPGPLCP